MKVRIKKINPSAVIPSYAKDGDAGMDLVATRIISNTTFDVSYGTDLAIEIPEGFVGLVFPRSSIRKYELILSNSVGVIDSGYRGEIQATFKKENGLDSLAYKIGDKIAQIIIYQVELPDFSEVPESVPLYTRTPTISNRKDNGFGSTDNK